MLKQISQHFLQNTSVVRYRRMDLVCDSVMVCHKVSTVATSFYHKIIFTEQREIQELTRKFTKDEIIPQAAHFDKTGEYPYEIVKKAHAVGLMNGLIPQEFGMLRGERIQ